MFDDDRLIYLVFKSQHKLQSYLKKELVAAGVKITPVQAGILFLLKQQNGRPMTELSQILFTDNSAITGLADRLEKSGFISREAAANDRRVNLIFITPSGIAEVEKAKAIITRVNSEIRQGFSDQEMETFKRILNSFFVKFNQG